MTLSDEYQSMAANAIAHAATMVQYACQEAASLYTLPHVVHKPKLYPDGDQWCALLGDNLQSGVCGFGDTPAKAMYAFDLAWDTPLAKGVTPRQPLTDADIDNAWDATPEEPNNIEMIRAFARIIEAKVHGS